MTHVTYLIGVGQLELPAVARPAYARLTAAVGQELQEELPELNGATAWGESLFVTNTSTDLTVVGIWAYGRKSKTGFIIRDTKKLVCTCVASQDGCWYHRPSQVGLVAHELFEAPVVLRQDKGVHLLDLSGPGQ